MKKIVLPLLGLLSFPFYLHSQDEEDKVNQEVNDDTELKEAASTYVNLSQDPSFILDDLAAKAKALLDKSKALAADGLDKAKDMAGDVMDKAKDVTNDVVGKDNVAKIIETMNQLKDKAAAEIDKAVNSEQAQALKDKIKKLIDDHTEAAVAPADEVAADAMVEVK